LEKKAVLFYNLYWVPPLLYFAEPP